MKKLFLLLLPSLALAQTQAVITRGDLLKQHQYKNFAASTLYVDPTGNDANSCTATGTSACLTTQGALNKLPKLLQYQASITHACGTYAGATVSGFTFDPQVQKTNSGLIIAGARSTSTGLATGTATGTASAGSAGTTTTYGTLTDASQTWTTNDLRGRFISITGGTGSGQLKMIVSNTGTVLTIAGVWTAPTGTSTYVVQDSCVTFNTNTTAIPATVTNAGGNISANTFIVANNNMVAGAVVFQDVAISGGLTAAGPGVVGIITSQTSGTNFIIAQQQVQLLIDTSSIHQTGSTGVQVLSASLVTRFANSLVWGATANGVILSQGSVSTSFSSTKIYAPIGIQVLTGSRGQATSINCDCASAANSACFSLEASNAPPTGSGSSTFSLVTALAVTDCTRGIAVSGGTVSLNSASATFTGNALTYAVDAQSGGSVTIPTTPGITATTAEMSVDNGAATDAFSTLTASGNCLTNITTGSRVCEF